MSLSSEDCTPGAPASASPPAPRIVVELSFSPPTYAFTRPAAPSATWRLTLAQPGDQSPVTLYTENSALEPGRAPSNNSFRIRDLSTGQLVKTADGRRIQIPGTTKRRVRGSYHERFFVTVRPGESTELTGTFGPLDGARPRPWPVVQTGYGVDDQGRSINVRRPAAVIGVDGLEPGREYEVGLNPELLQGIIWAPATKEDILLEHATHGPEDLLSSYPWVRDQPLEIEVRGARLAVLDNDDAGSTEGLLSLGRHTVRGSGGGTDSDGSGSIGSIESWSFRREYRKHLDSVGRPGP